MTVHAPARDLSDHAIREVLLRALAEYAEHAGTSRGAAAAAQIHRCAVGWPAAWDDALARAADRPWRGAVDDLVRDVNAAVRRDRRGLA